MGDTRRVALIHYWLVGMRGGEKVLEALCRMFPQADIFTHVAAPEQLSPTIKSHRIFESRIARLPLARKAYQSYLPLMPRALEELDLSGYDLVMSSEAGPAKGVIPPPGVPHLCYCHSPMRYIWDQYRAYRDTAGPIQRLMMPSIAHRLRQWDATSATRVDHFVANSSHVAARVKSYWRRNASVVHPPVAIEQFKPAAKEDIGNFYLWLGELAPYKRPDLAIDAFRELDLPLLVIGGPDSRIKSLAKRAGSKTQFLGRVSDQRIKRFLAHCRALVFPGEEDFGIVPVEAMASGRPVIAYGRGGVLDTVTDEQTGLFFQKQSVEALVDAVLRFEASELAIASAQDCLTRSKRFSETVFRAGISENLEQLGVGDRPPLRLQRAQA